MRHLASPPEWLVLDIETINGEPTDAEAWARASWSPSKNWKPATIGERFLEVVAKKEEQLALLDTSPIISVAVQSDVDCCVWHWMPTETQIGPAQIVRCVSESDMLRWVCAYLATVSLDTVLVGHNLLRFDLPKLRRAMLRHGICLPQALVSRDQCVYDTMREWSRFTLDERQYIGLGELLEACGIVDHHKVLAGGAMVPQLYAEGRYPEILAYAVADVLAEASLFLRMTGQWSGAGPTDDGHAAIEEAAAREVAAGPNGAHAAADPEGDLEDLLATFGVNTP